MTVGRWMQARGSTDTPLTPLSLASRESDGREQWSVKDGSEVSENGLAGMV